MGAWSHQPFDNDDALALIEEMKREGTMALGGALQDVLDLEYLEVPEASRAVAAAAFVAVSFGANVQIPTELEAAAAEWGSSTKGLKSIAASAIEKIRTGSELADLWAESEELEAWLKTLDLISSGLA